MSLVGENTIHGKKVISYATRKQILPSSELRSTESVLLSETKHLPVRRVRFVSVQGYQSSNAQADSSLPFRMARIRKWNSQPARPQAQLVRKNKPNTLISCICFL